MTTQQRPSETPGAYSRGFRSQPRPLSGSRRVDAMNGNGGNRRTGPTNRSRRKAVALLMAGSSLAGAAAGVGATLAVKNEQANNAQPGCDVPVRAGDNLSAVRQRIAMEGDAGNQAHVLIGGSGDEVRTAENSPGFNLNDSMGMQPGDRVEFEHVDPNVCLRVGGKVVKQAQK